jgi:thiol-disulfide isomerase/thioredoxin
MPRPVLELYGHSYCHLCDEMHAQLLILASELGFRVNIIDIHDDAELEARFGEFVPVLIGAGTEICHYHLDEQALRRYIGAG